MVDSLTARRPDPVAPKQAQIIPPPLCLTAGMSDRVQRYAIQSAHKHTLSLFMQHFTHVYQHMQPHMVRNMCPAEI